MIRRSRAHVVAGLALALTVSIPGVAQGASTLGQAPPPGTVEPDCPLTLAAQLDVAAGNTYRVPASGVITRWRSTMSGQGGLAVLRAAGAQHTLVGEDIVTMDGTLAEHPVSIPVDGGDVIGIKTTGPATACAYDTNVMADVIGATSPVPLGGTVTFGEEPGYRLNIAADVEPDVDRDGLGDETQDPCVACDEVAPETKLRGGTKKSDDGRAVFRFSSSELGSTFECKLKGKGLKRSLKKFKACKSPKRYSRLDPGRYTFSVLATDRAGNEDATPAKRRFKVVD